MFGLSRGHDGWYASHLPGRHESATSVLSFYPDSTCRLGEYPAETIQRQGTAAPIVKVILDAYPGWSHWSPGGDAGRYLEKPLDGW